MPLTSSELAPLFQAVAVALEGERLALNQGDPYNGNHGDHMLSIFYTALQAAQERQTEGLVPVLEYASQLLLEMGDNASAQAYGRGLAQLALQFRQSDIQMNDFLSYLYDAIRGKGSAQEGGTDHSGLVMKALASSLASWNQVEAGKTPSNKPLDLGYLFDLGIAYLQAKQRGGSRIETIAETVVSASPLARIPHRAHSGRLVIRTLLEAVQKPD